MYRERDAYIYIYICNWINQTYSMMRLRTSSMVSIVCAAAAIALSAIWATMSRKFGLGLGQCRVVRRHCICYATLEYLLLYNVVYYSIVCYIIVYHVDGTAVAYILRVVSSPAAEQARWCSLRPISVLTLWISEGLTQASS